MSSEFSNRYIASVFAVILLAFPVCAKATVFSWGIASYGSNTWVGGPPGHNASVSNSYANDASNGPGNDIKITVSQVNSGAGSDTWGIGPAVNTNLTPGGGSSLETETSTQANSTTYIKITISFIGYSAGVTGVSFTIYDVDLTTGQWIDQISSIQGTTPWSTTIGANPLVAVGGATYSVSGTATPLTQMATGISANTDANAHGNVNIVFGNVPVTEVSFLWSNQDPALGNQHIALSNITYTKAVAPEMNPGLVAVGMCALVVASRKFRFAGV